MWGVPISRPFWGSFTTIERATIVSLAQKLIMWGVPISRPWGCFTTIERTPMSLTQKHPQTLGEVSPSCYQQQVSAAPAQHSIAAAGAGDSKHVLHLSSLKRATVTIATLTLQQWPMHGQFWKNLSCTWDTIWLSRQQCCLQLAARCHISPFAKTHNFWNIFIEFLNLFLLVTQLLLCFTKALTKLIFWFFLSPW